MHGDTAGIDGGDARGRHDDGAFGCMLAYVFKKGGFARAGFAGKKKGAGCIVDKTGCQVKAGIGGVRLMHGE